MAKVLIAGCGDIGLRLAEILIKQGHQVIGLRRNPPHDQLARIQFISADMTQAEQLEKLPRDFDQIFIMPAPDGRNVANYQAVFMTGVDNLLQRYSGSAQKPHCFFISSTSVYGQNRGEWIDENSPAEPATATGNIIREAEKRILDDHPDNTIVRFSGIYGPGRERLIKMAQQTPLIQADPPYFTNRIHQDDCANVLAFLMAQRLAGTALAPVYLASDNNPAPLWDVMSWLTEQLKCPPPLAKPSPPDADQNKRCRNNTITTLGFRFQYPDFKNGYQELITQKQ